MAQANGQASNSMSNVHVDIVTHDSEANGRSFPLTNLGDTNGRSDTLINEETTPVDMQGHANVAYGWLANEEHVNSSENIRDDCHTVPVHIDACSNLVSMNFGDRSTGC